MGRYEDFAELIREIKEPKKSVLLSLFKDFLWLDEQIDKLRVFPRYIINPKNIMQQKKLEVHSMLKDYQAQKNDIATKILRALDNENVEEQSPLLKALAAFNNE